MTTTGYYVDGKGYIQIEDWEKDRFLSQYPGARQREKGKQVHYEVPNKGRIEISPEEETTFLSQYPNAVPSKYLEQRQSLLAETKKLTTDPLKLAELALPISDETLFELYNTAVAGQKGRQAAEDYYEVKSGYDVGYIAGQLGLPGMSGDHRAQVELHLLEKMPSGKTRKEEQDAAYDFEQNVGSITAKRKKNFAIQAGKYIMNAIEGLDNAIGSIGALPTSAVFNLMGNKDMAQQIQGYLDGRYERLGFSEPIEGNLLQRGMTLKAINAGFKSFVQSAPTTAIWMASPTVGGIVTAVTSGSQKYNELDREHPELSEKTKITSAVMSGLIEEIGRAHV